MELHIARRVMLVGLQTKIKLPASYAKKIISTQRTVENANLVQNTRSLMKIEFRAFLMT